MSLKDELKQINNDRKRLEREREAEIKKQQKQRNSTVKRLDPIVNKLLDQLGEAQWGRGLFGKKYKIIIIDGDWCVIHKTEKKVDREPAVGAYIFHHIHDGYKVRLILDQNFVLTVACKNNSLTTIDLSEVALAEALKKAYQYGPYEIIVRTRRVSVV